MTDIKFTRGDTVTKRLRIKKGGIPLILQEGDSGRLRIYDKADEIIIEKTFDMESQDDDGFIYIPFATSDTEDLQPKQNMRTIKYHYEIEIVGANGALFTPLLNGNFILYVDKITDR